MLQQFVRFKRGESSKQPPAGVRGTAHDAKILQMSRVPTHWDDVDAAEEVLDEDEEKSGNTKQRRKISFFHQTSQGRTNNYTTAAAVKTGLRKSADPQLEQGQQAAAGRQSADQHRNEEDRHHGNGRKSADQLRKLGLREDKAARKRSADPNRGGPVEDQGLGHRSRAADRKHRGKELAV